MQSLGADEFLVQHQVAAAGPGTPPPPFPCLSDRTGGHWVAVAHGYSPPVMPAWAPSRSESFFPWRGPLVQCCEPVSSSADACDTKTRASMRGREAGKRPPRKGRAELWSSEGEGGPAAGASALSVTTRGRCASPRTRPSFPWPRGPHLSPGSCRGPPFPPPPPHHMGSENRLPETPAGALLALLPVADTCRSSPAPSDPGCDAGRSLADGHAAADAPRGWL